MKRVAILVSAALVAMPTTAAQLVLTTEAFQEVEVTAEDGTRKKETIPAVKIVPGTELIYVITFRNPGPDAADDVIVTNPLPKELEYKADTATGSGAAVTFSVDGGNHYDRLEKLTLPDAQGGSRPARAADVTHLRWKLDYGLQAGEQGRVTYRAVLK